MPPRGDGCPCWNSWTYYYTVSAGRNSDQMLDAIRASFTKAGYRTHQSSVDDKPTVEINLDKDGYTTVTARTNEFNGQKHDPRRIYVEVSQMY